MMTSEDITRIKRGPADLEERIEQLIKQKEILKSACRKAGRRIEELEGEISIIKGIGMNSPEMRAAKARIEELERDNEIFRNDIDRLTEDKLNLETILRK
jgi:predicted  nucleic acid-binding Zn-ribbon protein